MMSSCLSGGSRAYGFDLDIVKSSSSSSTSSARSSHTSSPSSTLSESSHSSRTISIKRARTPRKRPHQTYNEAAALLSTIYPNIFSTKSSRNISKQTKLFEAFPESCSELLPPFPVPGDAAFLIRESSPEKPAFRIEPKVKSTFEKKCTSSVRNEFQEPFSPDPLEEDFDAESILDEEVEGGIDSIMGNLNLSMNATTNADDNEESPNCDSRINPYLRSLMGFFSASKFDLAFGFQFRRDMRRALRHSDDGEWWRSPTVPMQEIVPKFKTSTPSLEKKKKKKKVEKEEVGDMQTTTTTTKQGNLKSGLGLKLNHEEVLKAWSTHGSVFADGPDSPHSSAEALVCIKALFLIDNFEILCIVNHGFGFHQLDR